VEAPDTVGRFVAIYQNAQTLKLPVRYYCLVYMSLWANTHPMQRFYSRYLSGDQAFEMVRMVIDLSNQKFSTVLEDRLGMVLNLKFVEGQPLWRHQPTPTERFLKGWLEVCESHGVEGYTFRQREVRELTGYMADMGVREGEGLLDRADSWLEETTGDRTLLHFLCHVQDKPAPEPEYKEPAEPPWYERFIDEGEGVFDVTKTRAHWEEVDRNRQARHRAQPDSGPEYLDATLERLPNLDAANHRTNRHPRQ
jgi:hypothetical protein